MAEDTLRQVEKDFALHGIALLLNINDLEYPKIVEELALEMEKIQFIESPKMRAILYQIDLNESDLVANIQNVNAQNTYLFFADKILKRCFEKVIWRYKMRNQ
ncbi:hypothetical protein G3O08_00360 [Cryomorpha ignava]|uniref:Uncharacterized protein n=1 Tax=Cryomorpha ignava TaxID=101383 RepID=A0A7K3WMM8_9FLAO|nr:hypothetical protein [Cryomorpha ignava]NEN21955.1 hypothetical protein [Cryomorpha ignava]